MANEKDLTYIKKNFFNYPVSFIFQMKYLCAERDQFKDKKMVRNRIALAIYFPEFY